MNPAWCKRRALLVLPTQSTHHKLFCLALFFFSACLTHHKTPVCGLLKLVGMEELRLGSPWGGVLRVLVVSCVACACACPEKSPSCPGREPSVCPALCRKQWQVQHKSKSRTEPSGSCRQVGSRDGALMGSHTVSPAAGGGGQSPVGTCEGTGLSPLQINCPGGSGRWLLAGGASCLLRGCA